jgi:heme/copper-type cytochrome/quinol oxidase subunit 3
VRWLAAASLLGGAFLAGQWLEFQRLGGWRPADGVYNMLFGTLAGLHGLHVVGGLALLAVVLYRAQCGQFSARRHLAVTAATYYWYFVVVVWLAMLATMFLSWSV